MSVMSFEYRSKLVDLITDFRTDQAMASLDEISDTPRFIVADEIWQEINLMNDDELIAECAFMRAYQSFQRGESKEI
jgi:hypothetical protein